MVSRTWKSPPREDRAQIVIISAMIVIITVRQGANYWLTPNSLGAVLGETPIRVKRLAQNIRPNRPVELSNLLSHIVKFLGSIPCFPAVNMCSARHKILRLLERKHG